MIYSNHSQLLTRIAITLENVLSDSYPFSLKTPKATFSGQKSGLFTLKTLKLGKLKLTEIEADKTEGAQTLFLVG